MCFTNSIYSIFFVFGSLSLTDSLKNSRKTRIKLHKIAYAMSKNCLRGEGGRKKSGEGVSRENGRIAPWLLGDRRPWCWCGASWFTGLRLSFVRHRKLSIGGFLKKNYPFDAKLINTRFLFI